MGKTSSNSVQVLLYLPADCRQWLRMEAARQGIPMSKLVAIALGRMGYGKRKRRA